MNRRIHLILVLGCVIIAALDAPRASRLFSEGLSGPYANRAEARVLPVHPGPMEALPAAPRAEMRTPQGEMKPANVLLNTSVQVPENGF